MCFLNMMTPLGRFPFLTLYLATLRLSLHSQKHGNIYRIPDTPPATKQGLFVSEGAEGQIL